MYEHLDPDDENAAEKMQDYQPKWNRPFVARLFVAANSAGGSLLMMGIGARGPEPIWLPAYAVGGLVAEGVCGTMVVLWKKS